MFINIERFSLLFFLSIILVMATVEFDVSEFHSELSAEALHLGVLRFI